MIAVVAAGVLEELRARKFPLREIVYGPTVFQRVPGKTMVGMLRDTQSGDTFHAPTGAAPRGRVQDNGRVLARRDIGGECWVLASASIANATQADHEYLADQIVDGLQCAMYRWAAKARQPILISNGSLLEAPELPGNFDRFPGVVYRFKFTVARGVADSDFDGNGAPFGVITDVETDVDSVRVGEEN